MNLSLQTLCRTVGANEKLGTEAKEPPRRKNCESIYRAVVMRSNLRMIFKEQGLSFETRRAVMEDERRRTQNRKKRIVRVVLVVLCGIIVGAARYIFPSASVAPGK